MDFCQVSLIQCCDPVTLTYTKRMLFVNVRFMFFLCPVIIRQMRLCYAMFVANTCEASVTSAHTGSYGVSAGTNRLISLFFVWTKQDHPAQFELARRP